MVWFRSLKIHLLCKHLRQDHLIIKSWVFSVELSKTETDSG